MTPACQAAAASLQFRKPGIVPQSWRKDDTPMTGRPAILLAPVTLALAASMAQALSLQSVTVEGDTSATVKGWKPTRRPVTRINAAAAVALALLQSSNASLRKIAHDAATGDRKSQVALAMACPDCWETPADASKAIMEGKGGSKAIPAYERVAQDAIAKGVRLSAEYCEETAPAGDMWCSQHGDNAPTLPPTLASATPRPAEWFRKALHMGDAPAPVASAPAPDAKPSKGKRTSKGKAGKA